jgi:pyrroloquinoline quinone biosynthesis protein B
MTKFGELTSKEKNKIIFIHFNHTNPVLNKTSVESKTVEQNGFRIARRNDVFQL